MDHQSPLFLSGVQPAYAGYLSFPKIDSAKFLNSLSIPGLVLSFWEEG